VAPALPLLIAHTRELLCTTLTLLLVWCRLWMLLLLLQLSLQALNLGEGHSLPALGTQGLGYGTCASYAGNGTACP
jgi:hypothetical protein